MTAPVSVDSGAALDGVGVQRCGGMVSILSIYLVLAIEYSVSHAAIAKFLHPGPNEPSSFILTTVLGIVGALVATFLGQASGWYQGAGLIGATIGAIIVLVIWGLFARRGPQAFERVAGDGMNAA
jgi:uncharacterized membrane protein YeaQ/YmgE (transglycosylase-associated protein family)